MFAFVIGSIAVYAVIFGAGFALGWDDLRYQQQSWLLLACSLIVAPAAAAWVGADVVNRRRPRRAFDVRVRGWTGSALAGAVAALASSVVTAFLLVIVKERAPDVLITGTAALACSSLIVLRMKRVMPGRCVCCGYDTTGSAAPRCPECGAFDCR